MSTLNATDLFAVRRGSQTYKVSYQDVLAGVVLPSVLTYMGATNPAAAAPAPAGGLKAGMTYVLTPAGTLSAGWTGIAGINATDGQLAIWEGAKWELIGNTGAIPHATEAVSGIVELATAAETTTGTDNTRAVHPAGLKVELDKKAPLASPALTGTPTAPTAAAGTNTTQLATTAFVHAATPTATASVAGVDVKLWKKTGTTLETETAGDVVSVSKVGIGTAAPTEALEVIGAARIHPLPGVDTLLGYSTNQDNYFTTGNAGIQVFRNTAGEHARIDANGRLLVGTAAGVSKLTVRSDIEVQGIPNVVGDYWFLYGAVENVSKFGPAIGMSVESPASNRYGLILGTHLTSTSGIVKRMTISGTGAVNFTPGSGGVDLAVNATAWAAASDYRLKTDLEPITDGLNKVGSLRAVTGRYKTDEVGTSRSFLIAQDVQAVLPEAVSGTTDDDDQLSLRYTEVIPLLVAALKEAKDKIENLEAAVASLTPAP